MLPGNEPALLALPTTTLLLLGTRHTHSSLHSFENVSLILKGAVIWRIGLVLLSPSHLSKAGPHSREATKPPVQPCAHQYTSHYQLSYSRFSRGHVRVLLIIRRCTDKGKQETSSLSSPCTAPAPGIRRCSLGSSHSPTEH